MSISNDEVEHSCGCSRGLTIAGGSADCPPAASCPIDAAVCPQTTVCGILSELWLVHQQCTGVEQSRELIPVERVMQSRRRILSQASRGRLRNQHCNSKHLQSCIFRSQTLMAMRPLYKEADSYQKVALVSIRPVECSRTRALD